MKQLQISKITAMKRRDFLTLTSAMALTPALLQAQDAYDPTPQFVRIRNEFTPGELVVATPNHYLYWIVEPRKAIRYGIGVGKAGLAFKGTATIAVKKEWPTWRPTDEMIDREPKTYARFRNNDYVMPGGPSNPLGARALYLFQNGRDTYFRIHGTTQPDSIGRSVSNGCIRMLNEHAVDLYDRVPVGTVVRVL